MVLRVILVIACLAMPLLFLGCDDETGDVYGPRITSLEKWTTETAGPGLANANSVYNWKVNTFDPWKTNTFDPWKAAVDAKIGTAGTPASVDLSGYVLKSTYDTKVTDFEKRIAALESKPSGGGGGSGDAAKGEVLSTNGDLELSLEKSLDGELWINHNQGQTFFLNVYNKGTSGTYYRINANYDLIDASTVAVSSATIVVGNSSMISFAPTTTFPGTVSGFAFVSQAGSSGGSKIWIGKNSNVSIVLVLTVNYTDSNTPNKLWSWDYNIRQVN